MMQRIRSILSIGWVGFFLAYPANVFLRDVGLFCHALPIHFDINARKTECMYDQLEDG